MNTAVTTVKQRPARVHANGASGARALPVPPSRLRGWLKLLALCALVGGLIAAASDRSASYELSRLGRTLQTQASAMFGDKGKTKGKEAAAAATASPAELAADALERSPPEYSPLTRGRYAIEQIASDGHRFLAQFALDGFGIAHWNQTDRVLKSVEDFLFGGIRNLETRYDIAAPNRPGRRGQRGVDVLTVFGFLKAWKLLHASGTSAKAAQWAALSEYRAVLGQRVLAHSSRIGRAALKLGAVAGTAYLVARHPGLLTSLFVEAGDWIGLPTWAAVCSGLVACCVCAVGIVDAAVGRPDVVGAAADALGENRGVADRSGPKAHGAHGACGVSALRNMVHEQRPGARSSGCPTCAAGSPASASLVGPR